MTAYDWSYYGEVPPDEVEPFVVPALWRADHTRNGQSSERLTWDGWVQDAPMPDGLVPWTRAQAVSVITALVGVRSLSPSAYDDTPARRSATWAPGTRAPRTRAERVAWRIWWVAMLVVLVTLVVDEVLDHVT
jgi:hypothetical protein